MVCQLPARRTRTEWNGSLCGALSHSRQLSIQEAARLAKGTAGQSGLRQNSVPAEVVDRFRLKWLTVEG